MADKISSGDFVKIEFTGKRKVNGAVFDTTDEAKAKEAGIYNNNSTYGPTLVVVNKGMIVKGLDEALVGMGVGEQKTIEIPPEKAFGLRNPALVRVVPLAEFRKRDINPYPGMVVDLDGAPAIVRSVNSGRVMVDLNHALAGETIIYDVKVTSKIDGTEERAKALLENNKLNATKVAFNGGKLEVSFPSSDGPRDAEFFISKTTFIRAIRELLPEVNELEIKETYSLAKKK